MSTTSFRCPDQLSGALDRYIDLLGDVPRSQLLGSLIENYLEEPRLYDPKTTSVLNSPKKKLLTVTIPDETFETLRRYANENQVRMSNLLRYVLYQEVYMKDF